RRGDRDRSRSPARSDPRERKAARRRRRARGDRRPHRAERSGRRRLRRAARRPRPVRRHDGDASVEAAAPDRRRFTRDRATRRARPKSGPMTTPAYLEAVTLLKESVTAYQNITPAPADTDDGGEHVVPFDIRQWLARLRLLEGVPFAYLVADSELLPLESIRFFY